jgi:hypothetical protein
MNLVFDILILSLPLDTGAPPVHIVTKGSVTIDGVWIGDWIY